MTGNYLDQVPKKVHVLWARLLSVVGGLLSGAVLVNLLMAVVSQSGTPIQPLAVTIWGLFFLGCAWVFAKSFFATPRRPSPLAVKVFSVVASVVSLLFGALALFALVSKAGA
ncbi:hypothetical protein [Cognatilysobacter bugurensis]|uniref:Uncharacterized protein n=1 Tax=Cognatilysobacter bugurensis TaxID=543356 RepID=A0A918W886_9GAMM|nr:hypothetical protein [Lysobacter bugurensis]GHA76738.1 hypothetical protein GCM10007067_12510 [Lysobacter bugurensis]